MTDGAEPVRQEPAQMPGFFERILLRLGVIGQLLRLFTTGKNWWMAPLVLLLALLGLLLVVLNSIQVVAPFIYMVF
jgi:hypothetical protein